MIIMAARTRLEFSFLLSILLIMIWNTNISTAQHLDDVVLTSTLADDHTTPSGEEIVFTCTTRFSNILRWSSDEYIGRGGYNIQVYNGTLGTDVRRGSAHAILVRATLEIGVPVLVSELHIRVSTQHSTATIQCDNNGHGSSQTVTFALQNVTLTSTLTDDLVAYDEEEIVFTCTTRFSNILQWSSDEYIGSDGYNIQIYNGTLGTDVRRGSAHAILVRAAFEDGVLVLVSELRIRASIQHPTATIQCDNNGHGSNQTIMFALQNVTLTSTLTDDLVAYDKEEIIFTCTTRFSNILQWSSDEYIGSDGYNIQIYNGTLGTDVRRGSAHAILVRAALEDGLLVLVSELRIRASVLHPTATIQCDNNGYGSNQTIIFNSINRPIVRLNSSLSEGMFTCPGDRIQFECTTTDSQTLIWMSESYIGSDAAIRFSYNSSLNVPRTILADNYAMLMSKSIETGNIYLTATLSITVLESIRDYSHSVICLSDDMGAHTTISFHMAEMCEESTSSMSTKSNVKYASNNDDSQHDLLIMAIVIPVGVTAILIVTAIISIMLWILTCKGKSNKIGSCIGDQTQASQYEARDTYHGKIQAPLASPSSSTMPFDNKSISDTGSMRRITAGTMVSCEFEH